MAQSRVPLLSVTVLNYKYSRYLPSCLTSILEQTFSDLEVVVIDDRSPDRSLDVIRPFLADPRVRLIAHRENAGFVRSLIEGTEASESRYLTVVSADDFVLSHRAFERQIALLESDPAASFAYGAWRYVDVDDRLGAVVRPWRGDHIWSGEREFREVITRHYVLHTGTVIRRSAYRAAGGYDPEIKYTLDNTIWPLLACVGNVGYVDEPLFAYRTHGGNMSHSPTAIKATLNEFVRLVDRGFAALPECPTKHDRRLYRRARQAALVSMATMHLFAGQRLGGWRALAYAARMSPFETLLQPRVLSLLVRTIVGRRGFEILRGVGSVARGRIRAAAS